MKKLLSSLLIASIFIIGCQKEKVKEPDLILLNTSEKQMYHNDTYQIDAQSISKITYSSGNEYHAKVSESGLVNARFVGETNIILKNDEDTKKVRIIVKPKSNLYPEPAVKFGDSRSSIIAKFGTPDTQTSTGIGYANYSNTAPLLAFLFDSYDRLTSYSLLIKSAYSSSLADFLGERYLFIGLEYDIFLYINGFDEKTTTMAIGNTLYNISYWMVLYTPYVSNGKNINSINTDTFEDIIGLLQKI